MTGGSSPGGLHAGRKKTEGCFCSKEEACAILRPALRHSCLYFPTLSLNTQHLLLPVTLLLLRLIFSCSSKSSLWGARPAARWWTRTSWPRTRWTPSLWWLQINTRPTMKEAIKRIFSFWFSIVQMTMADIKHGMHIGMTKREQQWENNSSWSSLKTLQHFSHTAFILYVA